MKKIFALLLIALLCISCGKKEDYSIKIGALFPLTGELAQYGQSGKEGCLLALEENNLIHPNNIINIDIEDDKGSVKDGVSAFNKLVYGSKDNIIIGAMASGITLALAPIAESKHILMMAPTSTATAVTNAGDYIFRVCVSDEWEAKSMADYIALKFNGRNIGVLFINNDYGNGLKNNFLLQAAKNKLKVILTEGYDPQTRDFRSTINKFIKNGINLLYLVAQKEQSNLFQQMIELNYKPTITGSTMLEDPDILKFSNQLPDIFYSYRSYNPNDTTKVVENFVKGYQKKYNRIPDFYAASTYDATRVILYALNNTKPNPDSVKSFLYNLKNYPGVTGNITFDKNGDVVNGFSIKKITNGKFVYEKSK